MIWELLPSSPSEAKRLITKEFSGEFSWMVATFDCCAKAGVLSFSSIKNMVRKNWTDIGGVPLSEAVTTKLYDVLTS